MNVNENAAKSTIFSQKTLLNCRGRLLDLAIPRVMGIINVTPDSFYTSSTAHNEKELLSLAEKMLRDGAAVLDVGGLSSRPGAEIIPEAEELKRVIPAIHSIHNRFPEALISVDTWRSKVGEEAYQAGAAILNDISAGQWDENIFAVAAKRKMPYILMHMKGTPQNMQHDPRYDDVTKEVFDFMKEKLLLLRGLGVNDVILDPGFGFGKTVAHNFQLLNQLEAFKILGAPLLAGISRKSMICKILKVSPDHALNGTTALHAVALLNGVNLLRTHDVKEAIEVIELMKMLNVTKDRVNTGE